MGNDDNIVGVAHLSGGLKGLLSLLSILALVVPCVLGFVNLDKRQDIIENDVFTHQQTDEKRWECVADDIDKLEDVDSKLKDELNLMKIHHQELRTQFTEILRRLERIDSKIDSWEPTGQ